MSGGVLQVVVKWVWQKDSHKWSGCGKGDNLNLVPGRQTAMSEVRDCIVHVMEGSQISMLLSLPQSASKSK